MIKTVQQICQIAVDHFQTTTRVAIRAKMGTLQKHGAFKKHSNELFEIQKKSRYHSIHNDFANIQIVSCSVYYKKLFIFVRYSKNIF